MTSQERLRILRGIENRLDAVKSRFIDRDVPDQEVLDSLKLVNALIVAELKDMQAEDLSKSDETN